MLHRALRVVRWPRDRRQRYVWILSLGIGLVFVLLASRIAFGAHYLLPYDEGYHIGIIETYAHHLNPFLSSQPVGADAYGAVVRDPSYLYHYLMSFPFRLIVHITQTPMQQVFALRAINIALGLCTLYLVYRLMRRCGLSTLGSQLVAFGLAVTPVFYDVAAQVNYDNLLMPAVLLALLLGLRLVREIEQENLSFRLLGGFCATLLLASLIKFTFLPVAAALVIGVLAGGMRIAGLRGAWVQVARSYRRAGRRERAVVILLVLLASFAWGQRYAVNIVQYHDPNPDCAAVLPISSCSKYSIWVRNNQLHVTAPERSTVSTDPIAFTAYWLRSMYFEVYSLVYSSPDKVTYVTKDPVRIIARAVVVVGFMAGVAVLLKANKSWLLMGMVVTVYLAALWHQNYSDFSAMRVIVAVQGRYLLPIMPLVYGFAAFGYEAFYRAARERLSGTAYLQGFRSDLGVSIEQPTITPVDIEDAVQPLRVSS